MRGKFLHRLLGLGVLAVVVALAAASVAQAAPGPRLPVRGAHVALESKSTDTTPGQFGSVPDAFERAVLRSQAATLPSDSHERSTTVVQSYGYTPAALEALGQRWEAYAAAQGTGGQFDSVPVPDAFERAVLRSQAATLPSDSHERSTTTVQSYGYTPAALEALGQRWEAYAASQGAGSQISDSNGRVDLPATTLTPATGDDTGIAWIDIVYGMLLGFGLVALGGIAAFAVRSHGRVPQS